MQSLMVGGKSIYISEHERNDKKTKEVMEKYGIQDHELYGTKPTIQNAILVGIHIKFRANMIKSMEERSKLKYFLDGKIEWKPETPAKYIETLTRKQASLIFKARTRMIKAKGNYKNGFRNQNCRACKNALETHAHILYECEKLHPGTATSMRNGTQNNEGMRPTGHDTLTLTTDHERAIELGRTNYETNTTTVHKKNPDNCDIDTTTDSEKMDLFSEDPDKLKNIAITLDKIMTELMLKDN